ncbi:putative transcription factor C2H2 family [Rosa chinensis]|uniref:Putative transcription factor C2H2 family n=1 Tax=Rosa chinensis TaxID=74649 RepID=A0A2P6RJ09_ROSCH|nr:putative transcription factor C2H2 family [Rosa chinensis]
MMMRLRSNFQCTRKPNTLLHQRDTLKKFGRSPTQQRSFQSVLPSSTTSILLVLCNQASSGLMIVNFINTHFPPEDKIHLPKIVATIIDLVQKFIPLVPNGFIHVQRIEGVEIVHHVDDEVTKAKIHNHFEATKRGTCAICLDDFEVGRNTSRLPCLHVFHGPCIQCIVEWLDIDHHCPLCRYPLAPELVPWFSA